MIVLGKDIADNMQPLNSFCNVMWLKHDNSLFLIGYHIKPFYSMIYVATCQYTQLFYILTG